MIELKKYNLKRDGDRRCHSCYDSYSKEQTLNELTFDAFGRGGFQLILCNACLKELQKKISDRLVENDIEEVYGENK